MSDDATPAKVRLTDGLGPLAPKPPNAEGQTMCVVRWMVETPGGWVGAWDKGAFSALIDAALTTQAAEIERLRDELQLCCELKRKYQEQAARNPLGHEQACRLFEDWYHEDGSGVEFVRLVESAHGICGPN